MEDDFSKGFGIVVIVIIALLAMVGIFFPYLSSLNTVYSEQAYDAACQTFIKQHLLGNKFFESQDDNFPCKTQQVIIDSTRNYDILNDVTHSMLQCGNTFEMGSSELFSGKENTQQTFCAACYIVNFSKPDITISSTEYTQFIFSQKLDGSSETIAQHMMPKGVKVSQKDYEELQKQLPTTLTQSNSIQFLNTSEQYTIVFRYEKIHEESQIKDFIKRFGVGGAAGIIGSVVVTGGLSLIPISIGLAAGVGVGIWTYDADSNKAVLQRSEVLLVPFTPESLQTLGCDNIVGIQEPGITHKGYAP